MFIALHHLKLITGEVISNGKAVLIEGDKIIGLLDTLPAQAQQIDLDGAYPASGLIDLQIYSGRFSPLLRRRSTGFSLAQNDHT